MLLSMLTVTPACSQEQGHEVDGARLTAMFRGRAEIGLVSVLCPVILLATVPAAGTKITTLTQPITGHHSGGVSGQLNQLLSFYYSQVKC